MTLVYLRDKFGSDVLFTLKRYEKLERHYKIIIYILLLVDNTQINAHAGRRNGDPQLVFL